MWTSPTWGFICSGKRRSGNSRIWFPACGFSCCLTYTGLHLHPQPPACLAACSEPMSSAAERSSPLLLLYPLWCISAYHHSALQFGVHISSQQSHAITSSYSQGAEKLYDLPKITQGVCRRADPATLIFQTSGSFSCHCPILPLPT